MDMQIPKKGFDTNETINSARLTTRETDILACLLSGKSSKKIGDLLSISPKTVSVHLQKIISKLGCHSREQVIEHMERSTHCNHLKQRYAFLLMQKDFEQKLKHIAKSIKASAPRCFLFGQDNNKPPVMEKIQTHLQLAGIKIVPNSDEADYVICLARQAQDIQDISALYPSMCIFLAEDSHSGLEQQIPDAFYLDLNDDYPLMFLKALEHIVPKLAEQEICQDFKIQWADVFDITGEELGIDFLRRIESKIHGGSSWTRQLAHYKVPVWFGLAAIVAGGVIILDTQKEIFGTKIRKSVLPIRADLQIPTELGRLNRKFLLAQIDDQLKGKEGIKTAVLVGMGGTGKTTIARQYARTKDFPVIWEINADGLESLVESFERLAYALSDSTEEKIELDRIKKLENAEEYRERLLHFVTQKLLARKSWFLIFDNVKNPTDLNHFLPTDVKTWGQGKVLITTRNEQLKDHSHINNHNHIEVPNLNAEEQLALFTKIMDGKKNLVRTRDDLQKMQDFLKKIPPFPLDTVAAAYYIKSTGTSYEEYGADLLALHRDGIPALLFQELFDYTKTRYGIISRSIKQILDQHPEFMPLLVVISSVGSQNIPKDLLKLLKDKPCVDRFVAQMCKYSLLTNEEGPDHRFCAVSLHRSTQQMIALYLQNTLSETNRQRYVSDVVGAIEQYCAPMMEAVDIPRMRSFACHLEMVLEKSNDLFSPEHKGAIELLMGCYYYHFGDTKKAIFHLEESLKHLQKKTARLAHAKTYLGCIWDDLGKSEEAVKLLEESIVLYKEYFQACRKELAWSLLKLGFVYIRLGFYEKVNQVLEESAVIYKQYYGPQYMKIIWGKIYKCELLMRTGLVAQSKPYFEESIIQLKKLYGDEHNRTIFTLFRYGYALKLLGQYQKAKSIIEQSYQTYKKIYPEAITRIVWVETRLGEIYHVLGIYDKAIYYLELGLQHFLDCYGKNNINTERGANRILGSLYIDMKKYQQAKEILEPCVSVHRKNRHSMHPDLGEAIHALANAHTGLHEFQEAELLFQEVLTIYGNHYGKNNTEYAIALRDFGHMCLLKKDYAKAQDTLNDALSILQNNNHPEAYRCLEYLGDLEQTQGNLAKAKDHYQKALVIANKTFPKDSAHIARITSKNTL